jgi:hypothetical protein
VARTFHEITPAKRAALAGALAEVCKEVWRRFEATKGNRPVVSKSKPSMGPSTQEWLGVGFVWLVVVVIASFLSSGGGCHRLNHTWP